MTKFFRNDYFMAAIHCFTVSIWLYIIWPSIITEQKGKGYEGIRATEASYLSAKIQEVTSIVVITEKNEKPYVRQQLSISATQGSFSDKVIPDIDCFPDESAVQCDVLVAENAFVDDSK